jgi:putative addiction module component (TIGR02574 family)
MSATNLSDILKLSVDERLQLVEDIWDSIAAEPPALAVPDEQIAELDRRLDEAAANPGHGRPWSEVRDRLLGSR